MLRDLRYAMRSLAKSPGFVLVAALCLGLALALNTTTLAMLDAMLFPSLPVKHVDRLFEIRMWGWGWGGRRQGPTMWQRYSLLREAHFYEEIGFWGAGPMQATVRVGNDVSEMLVPRVSRNLFPLLGVRPELGHLIGPGSPDNVALISHDEWERSLGGRPLKGITMSVGDQEYRVIGVLPPEMTFPWYAKVWTAAPLASEQTGAGLDFVDPVVLLRPGAWESANREMGVLATRLTEMYGIVGRNPYAFSLTTLVPQREELSQIQIALAGAVFVVLLIACVNLASLMLVRGVAKRRELALRMAMGAGRSVLVRHVFTESVIIAGLGACLGLVLTLWAIALLRNRMPPSVATLGLVHPRASWRVFVGGLGVAAGTLALFGLWPAVRASDVDVSEPLKENSGAAIGRRHWRYSPLVITEVALSLVLLMSAALLTKAADRRSNLALGYDPTGLLDVGVWMFRHPSDSVTHLAQGVIARVRAYPGVRAAALYGGASPGVVAMSEAYDGTNGILTLDGVDHVSDAFLGTLGISVIAGRGLLPGDERDGAVIADENAARGLWPDGRAVGRVVKLGGPKSNAPWHRVVGVARSPRGPQPMADPFLRRQGRIYEAWAPTRPHFALAIRTGKLDPDEAVSLRQGIRDMLPPGASVFVSPWLSDFDLRLRAQRFLVAVFTLFSAFALLLAAIGLYGVVSYSVTQRMREFAVRVAVGAPAQAVTRQVVHDAAVMVLAGTGIGAFFAMWASQLLGDWLYTVYHTDAISLVIAEAVLLLAGLAASLQPALRAMRANPVEILRAI
jgi:putative ABC transport system permease protein